MPLGVESGLSPGHIVLAGYPVPPNKRGVQPPNFRPMSPQIFGSCLLWPNGRMDQCATWYGGRPRPRRLCVRWGPSSPKKKGHSPHPISVPCLLWPNGRMDQDATWYGGNLGPGDVVLDGVAAPPRGPQLPSFRFMSIVAKRPDG